MTVHIQHTPRTFHSVTDDVWPGDSVELYGYRYVMLPDGTYELKGAVYGYTPEPSKDVALSRRAA